MDRSEAMRHLNIALAAFGDLVRHPARSLVVTCCLVVILFTYLISLGISEGLRFQAKISLEEGADIYVSSDQCGINGPVRIDEVIQGLSHFDGIQRGAARIIGRTYFAERLVAVVGVDTQALEALRAEARVDAPRTAGEVILGQTLADEFGLKPGMPFSLAPNKRKVFRVIGTISPSSLWNSHLLAMHLDDANEFFGMAGYASHALIYLPPSSSPERSASITEQLRAERFNPFRFKVEDRGRCQSKLQTGYSLTSGIDSVLLVIGLALAVPTLVVTSGFGVSEQRKETGVMRATGWRTRDILEKAALENLAISLASVSLAILLAVSWIRGLNGMLIAQFFVSEVGLVPSVDIPFRILPSHAFLCLSLALVLTQTGGIISAWAGARTLPSQAMR